MTTFNYTNEELTNPLGNNDLSSRAKFFQRSLYKEAIYPEKTTKPLESWYDKNLFGRIDQSQNAITPLDYNLVPVTRTAYPGIVCLRFVNDAFTDFASHMQNAFITNCVNRGGNPALFNLRAVAGYVSPTEQYATFLQNLINAFVVNYTPSFDKPIKNFVDFKKEFLQYLKVMAESFPITATSYLISTGGSPFVSGLKLAIARGDASDDASKYQEFISDPNFLFYIQSAKKYGFLVDKNSPWVLTADLFSDAMQKYISLYLSPEGSSVTPDNFFNVYYTRSYVRDMSYLSHMFRQGYRHLYNRKPLFEEEKRVYYGCAAGEPGAIRIESGIRQAPSDTNSLTSKERIDLYTFLRRMEAGNSGPSLRSVRKRCYELYRADGISSLATTVSSYVNNSYKNFLYPVNYNRVNLDFDVDSSVQTDILDTALEISTTNGY